MSSLLSRILEPEYVPFLKTKLCWLWQDPASLQPRPALEPLSLSSRVQTGRLSTLSSTAHLDLNCPHKNHLFDSSELSKSLKLSWKSCLNAVKPKVVKPKGSWQLQSISPVQNMQHLHQYLYTMLQILGVSWQPPCLPRISKKTHNSS